MGGFLSLNVNRLGRMMLSDADCVVQRCMLANWSLRLVVELPAGPIDVNVPLGAYVLVALNGAALRFPPKLLSILGV